MREWEKGIVLCIFCGLKIYVYKSKKKEICSYGNRIYLFVFIFIFLSWTVSDRWAFCESCETVELSVFIFEVVTALSRITWGFWIVWFEGCFLWLFFVFKSFWSAVLFLDARLKCGFSFVRYYSNRRVNKRYIEGFNFFRRECYFFVIVKICVLNRFFKSGDGFSRINLGLFFSWICKIYRIYKFRMI